MTSAGDTQIKIGSSGDPICHAVVSPLTFNLFGCDFLQSDCRSIGSVGFKACRLRNRRSVLARLTEPWLLAALAALLLSRILVAQAPTSVLTPQRIPLPGDIKFTEADGIVTLIHQTITLKANEIRRLMGSVELSSSAASTIAYAEARVGCQLSGNFVGDIGGAAENHEGYNAPIAANYPSQGILALYPSLLFTAPSDGQYDCQLFVTNGDTPTLTAVATDGHESLTWLIVDQTDDAGFWLQNPPCDTTGFSACTYLGQDASTQKMESLVFADDGTVVPAWQAPADAAFLDAVAGVTVTTCYYGTGACTKNNWGPNVGLTPIVKGSGPTTINSYLEVFQLNNDSSVCKTYQSLPIQSTVTTPAHHYALNYLLQDIPVYPDCTSRSFRLQVVVDYVSGDPIKIDATDSNGSGTLAHAFVIEEMKGVARAIPNVVGANQTNAAQSITAAGYVVAANGLTILSTAKAGTVTAQNPAAGIIQLPNTAVQLTVSTGGAIVPNLLSYPQKNATAAITALGLIPVVRFSKDCVNPGDVMIQSPLGGVLVPLNTTVTLTVDSGTVKSCGILK
ncbi:PASTA domain-containing protein [Terracidiphilus gabretensis]|uniref:PASTA domain-containing protein n=1 Tax=Terracidiphilus gabretensis TaxID=1577687 RepID=UPI0012F97EF3|nr:PASTA domain-containing protein [Terracidiphilus gabretensis]